MGKRIEKIRLKTLNENHIIEFDIYIGRDLIIAEIEVPSLAIVKNISPLGLDISRNQKYKNKNLAR